MRISPYTLRAKAMVDAGEIGTFRKSEPAARRTSAPVARTCWSSARTCSTCMRIFLGDPKWVVSHVTANGEEIERKSRTTGTEPIGQIAGNQIARCLRSAMESTDILRPCRHSDGPLRFGTWLYGSKGVLFLPMAIYPAAAFTCCARLPGCRTNAIDGSESRLSSMLPAWEIASKAGHEIANALMVADLLDAIDTTASPAAMRMTDAGPSRWSTASIRRRRAVIV